MIKGFKDFLMRGNVVDLAVAVVLGAAFGALVTSIVENLLTPLIGAIGGNKDFRSLKFTIHNSEFFYGRVINALITFLLIAAAVYFFVIYPLKRLQDMRRRGEAASPSPSDEVVLLTEIRDLLRHLAQEPLVVVPVVRVAPPHVALVRRHVRQQRPILRGRDSPPVPGRRTGGGVHAGAVVRAGGTVGGCAFVGHDPSFCQDVRGYGADPRRAEVGRSRWGSWTRPRSWRNRPRRRPSH
jgi:large conductance mechanosensitive channel